MGKCKEEHRAGPASGGIRASDLILGFLQEKAAAQDPVHAQAYGLSWKEAPGSGRALFLEEETLCFDPPDLREAFLQDCEALEKDYRRLCLDVFSEKYRGVLPPFPSFFGEGGQRAGERGRQEAAGLNGADGIDYRTLLHRFCIPKEEAILDLDSFDYLPYLYGQGLLAPSPGEDRMLLLEPLEYREVNRLDELAIAIDTSGSCSGTTVRRFLEETWGILRQKENFFSHMRLHLIQCDSMIQDYRVFTSVEEWEEAIPDLKIQGFGNTDFRPVFSLLTDLIERREIRSLRALLYFTDGDGIFPRTAPPFETAFVFLNRETEKGTVPPWALWVNLEQ